MLGHGTCDGMRNNEKRPKLMRREELNKGIQCGGCCPICRSHICSCRHQGQKWSRSQRWSLRMVDTARFGREIWWDISSYRMCINP
ncbi:uncharacterized protein BP01DRAFT_92129 [Aspergillus saccharolyticus JOP 1030-1]|uniref:Uncharacterized protein n=1 Tax=Aspergillus saccharolyticus JOP 1030-1 TaxID=1450539 RepID=A0A318Z9B9_9EURO|nr:hypothetical protein BP01DRAFT_92129 [Aspergillus saccharolyticus JOP 1030-1]PYH43995.1 hypothetical protein BP01DRAFT_92129 [Aspergillus saccharolyticus JOP 1030-1]